MSPSDKPLILAAKRGHHNVVRRLLAEECDVTAQDDAGWSALMHAAFAGHVKVVQQLVEAIPGFENDLYAIDKLRALHLAAYSGHLDVIRALVVAGVNPEERIFWGPESIIHKTMCVVYPPDHVWHSKYTATDVAAARGDVAALRALRRTIDYDQYEAEPLEVAAATGQTAVVEYLLEEYYLQVQEQMDAVWAAARQGHLATLKVLLEPFDGCDMLQMSDEYLAVGLVYDDLKRTAGSDLNRMSRVLRGIKWVVHAWWDDLGLTWEIRRKFLLVEAIYKRDLDVIEALLAAKTDPNARLDDPSEVEPCFDPEDYEDGFTEDDEMKWLEVYDVIYSASSRYLQPVYDVVDEGGCDEEITPTPMTLAIQRNFTDAISLLVRAGAYINGHRDFYGGWSPLHTAANLDRLSAVKELLALGADPNSKTADDWKDGGSTPLHYARSSEVVQALLVARADPNARDAKGRTPLHRLPGTMEMWGGDACGITAALLAGGAAVNAKDAEGQTPLHCACPFMFPRLELVEHLLEAGADASLRDNSGRTPLGMLLARSSSHIISTGIPEERDPRSDPQYQWNCLGDHQICVAGALLSVTPGAWEALPDAERGPWWAAALGAVWRRAPQDYRRMCAQLGRPVRLRTVLEHLDRRMMEVMQATACGVQRWLPASQFSPKVRRRVLEAMFAASPYDY